MCLCTLQPHYIMVIYRTNSVLNYNRFHSSISLFVQYIHVIIHLFIHSFFHSFIHPSIHSFIHSFVRSIVRSFIHSHSFIHSFIHSFNHGIRSFKPLNLPFTYFFIHSFFYLFVLQVFQSLIYLFVCLFLLN